MSLAAASSAGITFEEQRACSELTYQWAFSYDTKNWTHLATLLFPTLYVDYTAVLGLGNLFPALPVEAFISQISSETQLGYELVATQHFIGGTTWQRTSDEEIVATHQLRAMHQRFADDGTGKRSTKVLGTAVGNGFVKLWYGKTGQGEEEEWKIKGVAPNILFQEGDIKAMLDPSLQ